MLIENKTKVETEVKVKTTVTKEHFAEIKFDEVVLPTKKFYNMVMDAAMHAMDTYEYFGYKVTHSELLADDKVCLRLNGKVVALVSEE